MMSLRLRETDLNWREIDDEIVVLDARDATYLAVQGSGTLLWRLLVQSASREDLVGALVDTYGIDQARAGDDVDAFVRSLATRELLAT